MALARFMLEMDAFPEGLTDMEAVLMRGARNALYLEGGPLAVRIARQQTSEVSAIASGDFWRDWDYAVSGGRGNTVSVDIFNRQPAVVTKAVEFGRKPKKKRPPKEAILEWMDTPGASRKLGHVDDPDSTAFLIARKIGEEGIEGRHVIETTRGILEAGDQLELIVSKYVSKEIDKAL